MAATRKEVAAITWENLPGYGLNQMRAGGVLGSSILLLKRGLIRIIASLVERYLVLRLKVHLF